MVVLATASPYKFAQDVMEAITGDTMAEWDALHALEDICQDPVPAPLAALESADILHDAVVDVPGMKEAVKDSCALTGRGSR